MRKPRFTEAEYVVLVHTECARFEPNPTDRKTLPSPALLSTRMEESLWKDTERSIRINI